MANSKAGSDPPENNTTENPESGDESEDESEVLEESPCGRWQKRREEVKQINMFLSLLAIFVRNCFC